MLTFRKHDVAEMPGWRLFAGTNCLGTIFNPGRAPASRDGGLPWQGVAPDGTRFGATSRPKLAQRLQIHAAKARTA